jgi:hypothetical protein
MELMPRAPKKLTTAWRVDVPSIGEYLHSAGPRLPRHDELMERIDEVVGIVDSSAYLRIPDKTAADTEAERRTVDAWPTRELAEWSLDELGIEFDRTRSDAYVVARAIAATESAAYHLREVVDAESEMPVEIAALFSTTPRTASARQKHLDSFRPRGCSREQFLERERNAWRQDAGPLAANGRPMSEIEAEIAENLTGVER